MAYQEDPKPVIIQLDGNSVLILRNALRLEIEYLEDKIKKVKFDHEATTYNMQLKRVHKLLKELD